MNSAAKHEKVIEKWMLAVIDDDGIERHDDLHIDRIDSRWKDRELWVSGALEVFQIAKSLRGHHLSQFTLSVAFSLRDGRRNLGPNFRTLKAFERRMDWMPPSLYLFRKGLEPWNRLEAGPIPDRALFTSTQIDASGLLGIQTPAFYIEFARNGSNKYGRSLSLVA